MKMCLLHVCRIFDGTIFNRVSAHADIRSIGQNLLSLTPFSSFIRFTGNFVDGRLVTEPFSGCLRLGLSWFNWWVSFAPEIQCCYFRESSCLFYLSFNFDLYVSKIMHL